MLRSLFDDDEDDDSRTTYDKNFNLPIRTFFFPKVSFISIFAVVIIINMSLYINWDDIESQLNGLYPISKKSNKNKNTRDTNSYKKTSGDERGRDEGVFRQSETFF